jgi:hypothetical protein
MSPGGLQEPPLSQTCSTGSQWTYWEVGVGGKFTLQQEGSPSQ